MPDPSRRAPRPRSIQAPRGADWFEITWESGKTQRISNRVLRGYCPCARCQGHSGPVSFASGNDDRLDEIEQVGNYALHLTWGDGHSSGIYSFQYLNKLGQLYEVHGDSLPEALPELPPG